MLTMLSTLMILTAAAFAIIVIAMTVSASWAKIAAALQFGTAGHAFPVRLREARSGTTGASKVATTRRHVRSAIAATA